MRVTALFLFDAMKMRNAPIARWTTLWNGLMWNPMSLSPVSSTKAGILDRPSFER